MAENILEGVQFRLPNIKFPHWNPKDPYVLNDTYGDWQDVPAGQVKFAKGTQLRVKPAVSYELVGDGFVKVHSNKTSALSEAASALEKGHNVTIRTVESTISKSIGPDRKLQARANDKGNWDSYAIGATPLTLAHPLTFRIRPDHYHIVTTQDSLIRGSVEFFDIEELAKYVDNRIRTSGLNFSVSKVPY